MKELLFTALLGIMFTTATVAQEKVYSSSGKPLNRSEKNVKSDKLIDPSRMIVGGWGVFGIASGFINLGISPTVGYRITDNFSAGIGLGYEYLRIKENNTVIVDANTGAFEYRPLNAHIYSPNVWARHIIWNNIFAQVQYEQNIISITTYTNDFTQYTTYPIIKEKTNVVVPALFLGGGLRQPIGDRTSLVFMLLYNVLHKNNSYYNNPLNIRIGFNYGF